MSTKNKPLKCACGTTDRTTKQHVGTNVIMRCPDCSGAGVYATKCRACCPTGHGTRGWTLTVDPAHVERLEAERCTAELASRSTRSIEGRKSIEESPLFGGVKQKDLFE